MRVWIDLANSPHALLFEPVVKALRERGHEVWLTARDNAQTAQLALERWPETEVIGGASPRARAGKARVLARRVAALRRWARGRRPDVAFSHNSYAQLLAARARGMPAVTAMDYEHQPANHLAFRLAESVLLPEAMRPLDLARLGANPGKVRFYPGFKEELYLGDFEPSEKVLEQLGIERGPTTIVVVARTPPSRALYHGHENPLFVAALGAIAADPRARTVVLARYADQRETLARLNLPNLLLPDHAIDSRSLTHTADLVLGAGGTMTREAALTGIPAYSVFAGKTPMVDIELARQGLLRRLEAPEQLLPLSRRPTEPHPPQALRRRGARLIEHFVAAATMSPVPGFAATANLAVQTTGMAA